MIVKRSIFFLALGLFLLLAALLTKVTLNRLERSVDLSGEWEVCLSKTSEPIGCSWKTAKIPESSNALSGGRYGQYDGWIHYRRFISPPTYCLPPNDGCSLFLAEVGDALRLRVNGRVLGMHGGFYPKFQYKKNHPVNIFIPSSDFNAASENRMELTSFSPKSTLIGIRLSPFLLTDSRTAQVFEFYILLRNIIVPLIAAGLLLLMGIATFFLYERAVVNDPEIRAYLIFIGVNFFFLISLSEVPREFFSLKILGFAHYLLRTCYDCSLFNLLVSVQLIPRRFKCAIYFLFAMVIGTFGTFLVASFFHRVTLFHFVNFDLAYMIMRISVPLVFVPGVLGAFGRYRDPINFKPLKVAMILTLPLLVSDILAFHNLIAATYTVKFYPLFIGTAFGWILLKRHLKEQELLAVLKEKDLIYKQISHDIRSPLSAMNHILCVSDELPENKRLLFRAAIGRVNDIANQLLNKPRIQSITDAGKTDSKTESALVGAVVDALVSEKRLSVQNKPYLSIFAALEHSYGLFTQIDPIEFKRAISNLIDNAIEAIGNREGSIDIFVRPENDQIRISIVDTGCGIPKDILARLGQPGITFGKEGSGSGLGVYHAKKTIESVRGEIKIQSEPQKGTEITLLLKRDPHPLWFVPFLKIEEKQTVVVLDDDISVLEFWRNRFAESKKQFEIDLVCLSSPKGLRNWLVDEPNSRGDTLYLIDFEFRGQNETGLELIRSLKLENAVIVTSRYEEAFLKQTCERFGIKIIPKGMAAFVPIKVVTKNDNSTFHS